jgi:hypothetical protein
MADGPFKQGRIAKEIAKALPINFANRTLSACFVKNGRLEFV